jgi:transposase
MTGAEGRSVIVGVDTHKHVHVAVAIDHHGTRLAQLTIAAERAGYEQLLGWARSLGRVISFGIEGTGSYGQGLTSFLRRHDQTVIEAGRPDRRDRRQNGKSDTLDAENAARSVLAGRATATPRRSEGVSEILGQTKVAKDTAVKARTQAIVTLKTLIVTAPDELRAELDGLSKAALRDRCAALRPGKVASPLAAAKHAIRALARRWVMLEAEIKEHEQIIDKLTEHVAPAMRAAFGIGPDVAAEMLIIAGDRPIERLRSEAAFAKLCGAAPIPASSGMTQRYRLNPGGHRQANSALYRAVIVRMRFHPATVTYVARRTAEGKTKREIIRCLKRYLAREIYHYLISPAAPAAAPI